MGAKLGPCTLPLPCHSLFRDLRSAISLACSSPPAYQPLFTTNVVITMKGAKVAASQVTTSFCCDHRTVVVAAMVSGAISQCRRRRVMFSPRDLCRSIYILHAETAVAAACSKSGGRRELINKLPSCNFNRQSI